MQSPQRGLAVSTIRRHDRIGCHNLRKPLDNSTIPSLAAHDAARAVGDNDGRQAHVSKLLGAALQVSFELNGVPVAGPACPRRRRCHPGRVNRNARGHHRPPLGFRHRFTTYNEHADPRLPTPPIHRCQDDFSSCSRPVSAAEVGYAESKVSTRALSRRLSLMLLDLF